MAARDGTQHPPSPNARAPWKRSRPSSRAALGGALALLLAPLRLEAAPAETAAPRAEPAASEATTGKTTVANPEPLEASVQAAPERDPGEGLRAYQAALAAKRLDASFALGVEQLRQIIEDAEAQLALGRRDEAIARLAAVVESPRFAPLASLEEGRAATFLLGDALGRAGAHTGARVYLRRLLGRTPADSWYRRAVSSLVDFGLQSGDAAPFLEELSALPGGAAEPWTGDVMYLRGALHERAGQLREALAAYAAVPAKARFWSQATYRAGLLEVEQGRLARGEQLFCQVADPKQTPQLAPLFGGNDFFQVRDLSRLALGRVAHEQYRFDDARYYYHLVPGDSDRLPEALYESATARYEAKDYGAARDLLAELRRLDRRHVYEDEAWILDAYVDLAACEFPRADAKLNAFLKRYEPVLGAARFLQGEPRALRSLLGAGENAPTSELGWSRDATELLRTSIRLDAGYGLLTRQLADVDHQLSGLRASRLELDDLRRRVADPGAVVARSHDAVADSPTDRLQRLEEQLAASRRLLREAHRGPSTPRQQLDVIKQELVQVEGEVAALRESVAPARVSSGSAGQDALATLLDRDAALAVELERSVSALGGALTLERDRLAREALSRLEKRLTRLVRRARAGRIETVLGKKRAVEVEIEALSQGFLPRGAVDSLDAARYLADDEEYWPMDGEDWEDEYVGGEGLR